MRMHINLKVKELPAAVRFYTRLFGAEPTMVRPDYARWILEEPRVNFAVGLSQTEPGIEHLGIQAESRDELGLLRDRISGTGGRVAEEGETVCCYSQSDKSWLEDDQGVSWEVFYTHGSSDTYHAGPREAAAGGAKQDCCRPGCCDSAEEARPS